MSRRAKAISGRSSAIRSSRRIPSWRGSKNTRWAESTCRRSLRHRSHQSSVNSRQSESSVDVEAIEVHHLDPRVDEVAHELLLRVGACVDFGDRTQMRIRPEDEIRAAARPLERVCLDVTALERLAGL